MPRSSRTCSSGGGRAFRYNWVNNQTQGPLTGTTSASRLGIVTNDGTSPALSTTAGTWPQQGKLFNVNLSGAAPTSGASLVIGTSFTKFGSLTLPFDLGPIGAPSCTAYIDHVVILPTATNTTGDAMIPLAMPMGIGQRVLVQWFNLDTAANALGWTTSDYGTITIGT